MGIFLSARGIFPADGANNSASQRKFGGTVVDARRGDEEATLQALSRDRRRSCV
jgi:hypothetical protein